MFSDMCVNLTILSIQNENFWVSGENSDDFEKETNICLAKIIQIKSHRFLVVDEECLKFEEGNKEQCKADDCQFNIQFYRNNDMPRGRAQTYMVCCKNLNQKGVSAKPLESIYILNTDICIHFEINSAYIYVTCNSVSFEAVPDAELMKLVLREVPECLYGFIKSWNMTEFMVLLLSH
uniref:Interleukin-18 n=1 Tax=Salmo trutta TaxID=8032 RepID=A0A673Z424_SALTR